MHQIKIDLETLLYVRNRDSKGNKEIYYNGLLIATYNQSTELKTWWIYFKNIDYRHAECRTEEDILNQAKEIFINWLTDNN